MKGTKHSYVMVALILGGGALFFSGATGGKAFLLWALACAGMMIAMMWGMRGIGQPALHTHPDALTPPRTTSLTASRPGGGTT